MPNCSGSAVVTAIPLSEGRFTVPSNRWDLLVNIPARPVSVAVVIPYYNQQHELDLVLTALDAQDYPAELLNIVIADDGSAQPPTIPAMRVSTTVVRQEDCGFRAAAARNLGAARAEAEVLCFLDADTIPQRDYIRRIVALPSVCPDALVVGRRRHADFAEWTPQHLRRWWLAGEAPSEFDEPRWLSEAYARSADLLRISADSYRYIISSVMCCSAELFDYVGGFDEAFRQYGGEDWEFAHRAMISGAVLAHARGAVAWHNGPDWAGRTIIDRARVKNLEALAVARVVPGPEARIPGLIYQIPEVAVAVDADVHGPGSLVAFLGCFLHLDIGVWLHGARGRALLDEAGLQDPRIHAGTIPDAVLRRCRYVVAAVGRAVLTRSVVDQLIARCGEEGTGTVTARAGSVSVTCSASWARHRRARWSTGDTLVAIPGDVSRISTTVDIPGQVREVDLDHPC